MLFEERLNSQLSATNLSPDLGESKVLYVKTAKLAEWSLDDLYRLYGENVEEDDPQIKSQFLGIYEAWFLSQLFALSGKCAQEMNYWNVIYHSQSSYLRWVVDGLPFQLYRKPVWNVGLSHWFKEVSKDSKKKLKLTRTRLKKLSDIIAFAISSIVTRDWDDLEADKRLDSLVNLNRLVLADVNTLIEVSEMKELALVIEGTRELLS